MNVRPENIIVNSCEYTPVYLIPSPGVTQGGSYFLASNTQDVQVQKPVSDNLKRFYENSGNLEGAVLGSTKPRILKKQSTNVVGNNLKLASFLLPKSEPMPVIQNGSNVNVPIPTKAILTPVTNVVLKPTATTVISKVVDNRTTINSKTVVNSKAVDNWTAVNTKTVDNWTTVNTKTVVNNKAVDSWTSVNTKSIENWTTVNTKPIDNRPTVTSKTNDNRTTVNTNSIENRTTVNTKPVDNRATVNSKTIDSANADTTNGNVNTPTLPLMEVDRKIVRVGTIPTTAKFTFPKVPPKLLPKEPLPAPPPPPPAPVAAPPNTTSVQLIKLGQTYHSLNQLNDDQMRIVNRALKVFNSNGGSGGAAVADKPNEPSHDSDSNTKYILKVVSAKDLAEATERNKLMAKKRGELKKQTQTFKKDDEEGQEDEVLAEPQVTRSGRTVKISRHVRRASPHRPKKKIVTNPVRCFQCSSQFSSLYRLQRHYENNPTHIPERVHSNLFHCLQAILKGNSKNYQAHMFVQQLDTLLKKLRSLLPCLLKKMDGSEGSPCSISDEIGRLFGMSPGRYNLNMDALNCVKDTEGHCIHNPAPTISIPTIIQARVRINEEENLSETEDCARINSVDKWPTVSKRILNKKRIAAENLNAKRIRLENENIELSIDDVVTLVSPDKDNVIHDHDKPKIIIEVPTPAEAPKLLDQTLKNLIEAPPRKMVEEIKTTIKLVKAKSVSPIRVNNKSKEPIVNNDLTQSTSADQSLVTAPVKFYSTHFDIRSSPIKLPSALVKKFQIKPVQASSYEVQMMRPFDLENDNAQSQNDVQNDNIQQNDVYNENIHQDGDYNENIHQNSVYNENIHQNDVYNERIHQNGVYNGNLQQNGVYSEHIEQNGVYNEHMQKNGVYDENMQQTNVHDENIKQNEGNAAHENEENDHENEDSLSNDDSFSLEQMFPDSEIPKEMLNELNDLSFQSNIFDSPITKALKDMNNFDQSLEKQSIFDPSLLDVTSDSIIEPPLSLKDKVDGYFEPAAIHVKTERPNGTRQSALLQVKERSRTLFKVLPPKQESMLADQLSSHRSILFDSSDKSSSCFESNAIHEQNGTTMTSTQRKNNGIFQLGINHSKDDTLISLSMIDDKSNDMMGPLRSMVNSESSVLEKPSSIIDSSLIDDKNLSDLSHSDFSNNDERLQGQSVLNFLESLTSDCLDYPETELRSNTEDFQLDLFSFNST